VGGTQYVSALSVRVCVRRHVRPSEGAANESAGTLKTRDWKTQDWKTWDQIAAVEMAGLENAGSSCVWVAKCNIINVRGYVRVNVTAGRGDPCTLQEAIQSGN